MLAPEPQYVLGFPAPPPVKELYGNARAKCFRELGFQLEPGTRELVIEVKTGFYLSPDAMHRFAVTIDHYQRVKRLTGLEAELGSIGRFREPEDTVYWEVGGASLNEFVQDVLFELDRLGVPHTALDGQTLYVALSKNCEKHELQDLAFGVCSDLCACRTRPRAALLDELVLYDRFRQQPVRSWSIARH